MTRNERILIAIKQFTERMINSGPKACQDYIENLEKDINEITRQPNGKTD